MKAEVKFQKVKDLDLIEAVKVLKGGPSKWERMPTTQLQEVLDIGEENRDFQFSRDNGWHGGQLWRAVKPNIKLGWKQRGIYSTLARNQFTLTKHLDGYEWTSGGWHDEPKETHIVMGLREFLEKREQQSPSDIFAQQVEVAAGLMEDSLRKGMKIDFKHVNAEVADASNIVDLVWDTIQKASLGSRDHVGLISTITEEWLVQESIDGTSWGRTRPTLVVKPYPTDEEIREDIYSKCFINHHQKQGYSESVLTAAKEEAYSRVVDEWTKHVQLHHLAASYWVMVWEKAMLKLKEMAEFKEE